MVKALQDATVELRSTPSVEKVDTEVGQLDHMRNGSSEVQRVHGSNVSVSANPSVPEQLATNLLKLLRDAVVASTPTPSVENLRAFFG